MVLKACLNGARTRADHPRLPVSAAELAEATVRSAAPGLPIGVTTGAWASPDATARVQAIRSCRVLPDFASVN